MRQRLKVIRKQINKTVGESAAPVIMVNWEPGGYEPKPGELVKVVKYPDEVKKSKVGPANS